jgi:hypothetical protein
MKIQRATFLGVRGVTDVTLELTDPRTNAPHGLVVFTGPSGSGKTRLLEALIAAKEAVGALGPMTPGAPWIREGSGAKILLTFQLDESERTYADSSSPSIDTEVIFTEERVRVEAPDGLRALLERYSHDPAQGKLEYFPAMRKIPAHPPYGGLGVAEQRIARPGKDPRKYGFVVSFLRTLEYSRVAAEAFAARLAALSPTCRYLARPLEDAEPRCLQSRGGPPVTPAELSDGEADAVVFAATAVVIGLEHSLVFVDRPDLHLDDAVRLLGGLGALGQDNQLFVASGPELAAAAAGARIVPLRETGAPGPKG